MKRSKRNPTTRRYSEPTTARKSHLPGHVANVRAGDALGPYSGAFNDFVFREVNPYLYEAIREAVPVINGAIHRLKTLDGIVRVEAANDKLQKPLDEFMQGVAVQDMQLGYQSFYDLLMNEKYEQGHVLGEWELNPNHRGVARLRVADSKGTYFLRDKETGQLGSWYRPPSPQRGRRDGTDNVERVLRNNYQTHSILNFLPQSGYRKLDPSAMIYIGFNNEADNPYGTSIMRSIEFDARVSLVMKNALHNTWERFGNPSFSITLKKKRKNKALNGLPLSETIEQERKNLSQGIADAMAAKQAGNNADLVNVIGPDDELDITVLGGDGQVLEIEMPARYINEAIVANTGLAGWLLGLQFNTAERLAAKQAEMALQESYTRFASAEPMLRKPIDAHLRSLGRAFRPEDYQLVQDVPNLGDIVGQAQANQMNATAEAIRGGRDVNVDQRQRRDDVAPDKDKLLAEGTYLLKKPEIILPARPSKKLEDLCKHHHGLKMETYVEDAPALMALEQRAERSLKTAWDELYAAVIGVLGVAGDKSMKADHPVFAYDPAVMLYELRRVMDEFVKSVAAEDAPLVQSMVDAWLRGVANASAELDVANVVADDMLAAVTRQLAAEGFDQVRETVTRTYRNDILSEIEEGIYNGQNPNEVARQLKKRFDDLNSNWARLARTEIGNAQVLGKDNHFAANGIEEYEIVLAGGACPVCVAFAAQGPYPVGSGILPGKSTHPNDRCTIRAVIPDEQQAAA